RNWSRIDLGDSSYARSFLARSPEHTRRKRHRFGPWCENVHDRIFTGGNDYRVGKWRHAEDIQAVSYARQVAEQMEPEGSETQKEVSIEESGTESQEEDPKLGG